jgi:hypothetical protein
MRHLLRILGLTQAQVDQPLVEDGLVSGEVVGVHRVGVAAPLSHTPRNPGGSRDPTRVLNQIAYSWYPVGVCRRTTPLLTEDGMRLMVRRVKQRRSVPLPHAIREVHRYGAATIANNRVVSKNPQPRRNAPHLALVPRRTVVDRYPLHSNTPGYRKPSTACKPGRFLGTRGPTAVFEALSRRAVGCLCVAKVVVKVARECYGVYPVGGIDLTAVGLYARLGARGHREQQSSQNGERGQ